MQLRAGFEALIVVDAAACDFGAHKPCIGGDTECFEVPRCMFVVCALKSSYLGDPGTVFLDLDGVGKLSLALTRSAPPLGTVRVW